MWTPSKEGPEYEAYHRKVVDACAALMGEEHRNFFDRECSYVDEFKEGQDPEEVAQNQYDALC